MKISTLLQVSAGFAGLCAFSLFADQILYNQLTTGASSVTISGYATVTASGGTFDEKTWDNVTGTGVKNGLVDGEIDEKEAITISFVNPQDIDQFQVAFLYDAGVCGDSKDEFAVVYDDGTKNILQLTGSTGTTATWSGAGTVTCISPGANGGAGLFEVTNPFGTKAISSITFGADPSATSASGADYAFEEIKTHSVPEPSSLSLILIGISSLIGFGITRRKK